MNNGKSYQNNSNKFSGRGRQNKNTFGIIHDLGELEENGENQQRPQPQL